MYPSSEPTMKEKIIAAISQGELNKAKVLIEEIALKEPDDKLAIAYGALKMAIQAGPRGVFYKEDIESAAQNVAWYFEVKEAKERR